MRTHRSVLNFASGILFTLATTLTAFFTTPLLLAWLNPVRFGAYRMITDWNGYLTLLDFGLGGALLPLLARALGQGDTPMLRKVLAAGTRAYLWLTLVMLAAGVAMMPLVVWSVGVPAALRGDLRLAWILNLLSFLPLGLAPFRSIAEASQRSYWINTLMTFQCLLITALALIFAWGGLGISGQALAFTLGIFSFFAMLTWDGLRHDPGLLRAPVSAVADPGVWSAILSLSVPSLILSLSGRVGLLSDNLIAGGFLGPAMAASLYITVRLASLVQIQLQAIGAASWAGLAELHAQGAREVFNRRLVELTTLVAVLGLAVLGPVAAYNRHFFELWVGSRLIPFGGNRVVVVAALNAFLLGLFSLWGWCFSGTGQMRLMVAPSLLATAINLAASLVLTWRLGLVGPALGTLVASLTISLWYLPLLLRRYFGISLRALGWAIAWPLVWGVPYALGLWWVAHVHRPRGWAGLIAEMGGAALGFLAVSAVLILSPTDRALWRLRWSGFVQIWKEAMGWRPGSPEQSDRIAARPADIVIPSSDHGTHDDGHAHR